MERLEAAREDRRILFSESSQDRMQRYGEVFDRLFSGEVTLKELPPEEREGYKKTLDLYGHLYGYSQDSSGEDYESEPSC